MRNLIGRVVAKGPTATGGMAAVIVLAFMVICLPVAADLADPTRPPVVRKTPPPTPMNEPLQLPQWRVTFVKITSTSRYAVINGVSLTEGDELDNATVTDIRPERVELTLGKRTIAVKVYRGEAMKKPIDHHQSGRESAGSS